MYDLQNIASLIKEYAEGNLSVEKEKELSSWLDADPKNRAFFEDILNKKDWKEDVATFYKANYNSSTADQVAKLTAVVKERIAESGGSFATQKEKTAIRIWYYAAAVVAVLLLFVGINYLNERTPAIEIYDVALYPEVAQVAPGVNSGILQMSDGRVIALKEGSKALRLEDGLSYENGEQLLTAAEWSAFKKRPDASLTLEVPAKSYYEILLADGTRVWVNAGSKLIFPAEFASDGRELELIGEGYFEVAAQELDEQSVPFLVRSGAQLLEVLGTKFNISAYPEAAGIRTTLVEGRVAVSAKDEEAVHLTAGKQSLYNVQGFKVREVDVEQAIAWKNGFFQFDGLKATEAFEQLARWYGITVSYEGKRLNVPFYGIIERDKNLSAVLDILQAAGLRFKMKINGEQKELIVLDK